MCVNSIILEIVFVRGFFLFFVGGGVVVVCFIVVEEELVFVGYLFCVGSKCFMLYLVEFLKSFY